MGVNSLRKTVTRQCRDCDLNLGPSAPESSTLTTRLASHLYFCITKRNAQRGNLCLLIHLFSVAYCTCLMKHFATWLQLILFAQQFSCSEAICVFVEINGTLKQFIQRVVAWKWWHWQITEAVDTSIWWRTITIPCKLTLTHNMLTINTEQTNNDVIG